MEPLGFVRNRRVSGWVGFLAVVVALRLAGIGSPPPEVGAAPAEPVAPAHDPTATLANRAFAWLLTDFDVSQLAPATERCLDAGPRCTTDDLLDLDTTRIRLVSLVDLIGDATDPAAPGYLGQPDRWMIKRVAETRSAAEAAAGALNGFVAAGCAGSVDGVVVAQLPPSCGAAAATARHSLASVAAVLGEWP